MKCKNRNNFDLNKPKTHVEPFSVKIEDKISLYGDDFRTSSRGKALCP